MSGVTAISGLPRRAHTLPGSAPAPAARRSERVLAAITMLQHPAGLERDLNAYLERVAAAICDALDYRVCVIYLYDHCDDTFYAEATCGVTIEERHALLATPVPTRVAEQLINERYGLDWSFYVPASDSVWNDPDVSSCFTMSATPTARRQPGWQPGDLFLAPLEIDGRHPIGFLVIDEPVDGRFPEPETLLGIATLARMCANAVESAHLYRERSEEAAISSALLQVSEAVGTPDQTLLITRAGAILANLLGADQCAAWHVDDDVVAFHPVVDPLQWTGSLAPQEVWAQENGLRPHLLRGEPIAVEQAGGTGAGALVARLGLASALLIPLFLRDRCAGAIVVGWTRAGHRFRIRDLDIARGVSRLVGVALETARLYQDTTRQAERNARLYEREREGVQRLQELDQLRNDFVSTVSHELRTPLTGIKGFTDTLLNYWERMDDTRRLDMVRKINNSSNRLERLVHDLLYVSRIESGVLPLQRLPAVLRPLIDGAIQEVEGKYRGQVIEVRAPDQAVTAFADPDRLQQVLVNLLDNAAKYSLEGRPIRVRLTRNEHSAQITVLDCGPGIEPADFARIFTRFGKLSHTPRAGHVGTGLGLYISKSLVETMGGNIRVRSRLGWGTRFTVTIPLAKNLG